MRVFLTGATGLLGSHAAAALRARGDEVVALHRRSSDTDFLARHGCELVEGDVRDSPDVLAGVLAGSTHVVHAAALVYAGASWPKVRAVNVEGTANVLEAAARVGVSHAVHVSSVAVYGTVEEPVDESSPIDTALPATDLYARSKREAEVEARRVEAEHGLAVTVLRPSAVYGERDRLFAPTIAGMTRGPVTFRLGDGHNARPAVYAGNVAEAILLALDAGRGGVAATWDVGLDHRTTQRELLGGIAAGMDRTPRFVPLPAPLVRVGADVLQRFGVSAPGAEHLPLGRAARLSLNENPYPSDAIRRDLGWAPSHHPSDALERTGRWLAENLDREEPTE